MPCTCPAVEIRLMKSGYHNPGYFVFAGMNYIFSGRQAIKTAAWPAHTAALKAPDSWEQIAVMEPVFSLLVCLEGKQRLNTGIAWKVESQQAFNVDLTGSPIRS